MGISKTIDYIKIKIQMTTPKQEPPAASKAPKEDLKDMDVLCTFKIKIEIKKSAHWFIKYQWPYPNKIKMPNPSQEHLASSKAQYEDLKDMDVLCTLKIKKENQNLDHEYTKDQWPYLN